jgi:hypothetical protein
MAKNQGTIIKIADNVISVGLTDGTFFDISISELDFSPSVGDQVNVFSNGEAKIITKIDNGNRFSPSGGDKESHNAAKITNEANILDLQGPQIVCPKCYNSCYEFSKTCPFCGYVFPSVGKRILIALCIAIPIIAVMFLIKQCSEPAKVEMNVSITELHNEFVQHEIRAGKKYNGKRIGISGCVGDIDGTYGEYNMIVNIEECGRWFPSSIPASMKRNQKDKIAKLNKGMRIRVECTIVDGGDWMGIKTKNCIISNN